MTEIAFGDQLGPRGQRRVLVASIVALIVLVAVGFVALRRFADNGQLAWKLWEPLFTGDGFTFLWGGLRNTLTAAATAMVLATLVGLLLALGRISRFEVVRVVVFGWVQFFRGIPLLLLIIFLYFGMPSLGIDLGRFWFLVLGLSIYNSAVICEIVRAGILSLDRGQSEAAKALGLTQTQTMRIVVLPQALRRMLPAMVSQMVIMLKDTSLGVAIGYEELLRRAQIVGDYYGNPLQAYILVAVIYLVVNLALSRLAEWIERRQRRGGRPVPTEPGEADTVTGLASLNVEPFHS